MACRSGNSEHVRRILHSEEARPNDITYENETSLGVSSEITSQNIPHPHLPLQKETKIKKKEKKRKN
jgi:hypothetical protein